jgi:uncharacterized protein (DUF697 family)
MTTAREEATAWVHRYAIGGAVFAALPLPFTTAGLIGLEVHMMSTLDEVYGGPLKGVTTSAVKGALALVGPAVKLAARKATSSAPKAVAPLVRAAVAAAIIEALGHATIFYLERKSPGKAYKPTQSTSFRDGAKSGDGRSATSASPAN